MDSASEKVLVHIIRNTRVAALGTLRDEAPRVSSVAFVAANDFSLFYIHVGKLAEHTVDMMKDKRVSLLLAETDDGRPDPQTLSSLSIRGSAEFMKNGEPGYALAKKKYLERFPKSAPMFKSDDFGLWRIKPKGAHFIAGLGKVYNLTPEALQKISQIDAL